MLRRAGGEGHRYCCHACQGQRCGDCAGGAAALQNLRRDYIKVPGAHVPAAGHLCRPNEDPFGGIEPAAGCALCKGRDAQVTNCKRGTASGATARACSGWLSVLHL